MSIYFFAVVFRPLDPILRRSFPAFVAERNKRTIRPKASPGPAYKVISTQSPTVYEMLSWKSPWKRRQTSDHCKKQLQPRWRQESCMVGEKAKQEVISSRKRLFLSDM